MDNTEHFRIHELPPFLLGEIAQAVIAARSAGRDVIDFSQLNPNLGPPGAAVEKLVQASLQPHNHRYSSSQGILKLRESLSAWYRKQFQVELSAEEEVLVTMGTKQGLSHLLFAVVHPGDVVLVPTPSYPIHDASVVLAGAHLAAVDLPSPESCNGVIDAANDEFFAALLHAYEASWPRPKMMIVSFPHNPTALVATREFFERLVELAREKQLSIIHDFAYADLGYDGYRPPSIMEVAGAKDVAVELVSFSKGLSMPGWRIGACVGKPSLVGALKKIKSYLDYGVFQPIQIAAISALQGYDPVLAETRDMYRARRDVLCSGLEQLGFHFVIPRGSLFVWARLPEKLRGAGSLAASMRLLEECDVAVCPGIGFHQHADEHVRFALVEPEARIRSGLARMSRLLGGASV